MPVRWRGIEIAGALAVAGVLVLVVLTFWPESESQDAVVAPASGDSILAPVEETASPTPEATEQPSESRAETSDASENQEPADIPAERRPQIAVQVLNAGAQDGAAALATGALAEQSFDPREPADAVAESSGTRVLHAENRRRAAFTVGRVVGADQIRRVPADDPNWAEYGADLDVLVIVGPPLP